MEQARHGASEGLRGIDNRTRGVGSTAVEKAGSAAGRTKRTAGNVATSVLSEKKVEKGKQIGQAGKKGGKRAISDTHAGVDYATRNLDQSPVDWAEAGLERYRENPVVDTADESGSKQQELSDWSDSPSEKGQSK